MGAEAARRIWPYSCPAAEFRPLGRFHFQRFGSSSRTKGEANTTSLHCSAARAPAVSPFSRKMRGSSLTSTTTVPEAHTGQHLAGRGRIDDRVIESLARPRPSL